MKLDKEKTTLLMARKHLTQKELADKAGMSRSNLSTVINGKTCRPSTVLRVADALEVELEDILAK